MLSNVFNVDGCIRTSIDRLDHPDRFKGAFSRRIQPKVRRCRIPAFENTRRVVLPT